MPCICDGELSAEEHVATFQNSHFGMVGMAALKLMVQYVKDYEECLDSDQIKALRSAMLLAFEHMLNECPEKK